MICVVFRPGGAGLEVHGPFADEDLATMYAELKWPNSKREWTTEALLAPPSWDPEPTRPPDYLYRGRIFIRPTGDGWLLGSDAAFPFHGEGFIDGDYQGAVKVWRI